MFEVPEESSALEAAAEAAGAGDFAAAERHLNQAVELKQARLGPMHPDLASILNNLGVVHEHLDQPADAERCYRRAHAIATAVLAPDDPAVVLSTKNLQDFCAARGIPFEQPAASAFAPKGASAFAAGAASAFAAGAATADKSADKPVAPVAPVAPKISPRTLAVGWLVVIGVILAALVIGNRSRSTSREPVASPPVASAPVAPTPAASREPGPVTAPPTLPAPAPAPRPTPAPPPQRPSATAEAAASTATATVVSAQLCRAIDTGDAWRCTPITGSVEPGPVFFYTRLTCRSDTTVEHRWYRANRLQQTTTLHIKANEGTGYRTYSRATISADRTGEWRVELRAMDGTVLHEERFTVSSP